MVVSGYYLYLCGDIYFASFLPAGEEDFMALVSRAGALCNTPAVLVPCCPPAWKEKAARMQRSWAQSQHGVGSAAGRWLPAQSPAWTRELEMLLGPIQPLGHLPEMNQPQSQGLIKRSLGLDQSWVFDPQPRHSGHHKSNTLFDKHHASV